MMKHKNLEYPWNLIEDVLFEMPDADVEPADIERGIEHLMLTAVDDRTRAMLEMKYKEGMSNRIIGEHFGLRPTRVAEILRAAERRFRHPKRSVFILRGYSVGIEREKKELERQRLFRESSDNWTRVAGTYPNHIHSIEDPYKRIDAIFDRGGAETVWRLGFGTKVNNILFRHGIEYIYQLCFCTDETLLGFSHCGVGTVTRIEDKLYQWDLAFDDGLLSEESFQEAYEKYAMEKHYCIRREARAVRRNKNGPIT